LIEDGIAAVVGAAADSTVLGIIGFALNPRKALMAALLETATGFSSFALLQVIPIIKKILGLFERFNFERRSVKRRLQTCRDRMGDVDMALERARHVTVETRRRVALPLRPMPRGTPRNEGKLEPKASGGSFATRTLPFRSNRHALGNKIQGFDWQTHS
jgi:hypothetical protein